MLFLLVLFVEWGSHGLAFSHAYSAEGQAQAVAFGESDHEDPCKTMIHGPSGTNQERPVPTAGHDITQTNSFFDSSLGSRQLYAAADPTRSRGSKVSELFRPVSPPFHPPELS